MALEVSKLRTEVDALLEANPPTALVRRSGQTVVVYPKN
jgi:MerR family transcriptional regulator/heat shock protein HspR